MNIAYISTILCISCLNSYLLDGHHKNPAKSVNIILQKRESNMTEVEPGESVVLELPKRVQHTSVDSLKVFHFDQMMKSKRRFYGFNLLEADILPGIYKVEIRTDMDKPTRDVYTATFRKKDNISCLYGTVKCSKKNGFRYPCENGICCINNYGVRSCSCDQFFSGTTCNTVDYLAVLAAYNRVTFHDQEHGAPTFVYPEMSDHNPKKKPSPAPLSPPWVLLISATGFIIFISLLLYICCEIGLLWHLLSQVRALLGSRTRPERLERVLLSRIEESPV